MNATNPYSMFNRCWTGDVKTLKFGEDEIRSAVARTVQPVFIVDVNGRESVTHRGTAVFGKTMPIREAIHDGDPGKTYPLLAYAPPLHPADLGDASFRKDIGIRYAYIVGAMANGITSVAMLKAAGQAGMIGFFGAGGLSIDQVDKAISCIQKDQPAFPFGFNLIHSPNEPRLEEVIVELYLNRGIHLVSASAYLGLTEPLVYYRVKGIHETQDGQIICPNHVIAKVSRVEVARKFFAPPPQKILEQLLQKGKISPREAQLAQHIPLAQDMSAEADSGGHTDNRPALTLLPTFLALRDEAMQKYAFKVPLRVGLGGGIATPESASAAFAMGAAYILTGSINQACIESDTSETVRKMLVQAEQADVIMAPAADMFELGAKVQVLKRGTMFAMRGAKLYELYRTYDRFEQIPATVRAAVEKDILRASFEETWERTCHYFMDRDPSQIQRGEKDPKHKMALVFRSYLGLASLWAKNGDPQRQMDYQIWCGPAMGAFNAWAKGSCLEAVAQRRTADLAMNLLYGAACLTRFHWLRSQGVSLGPMALRPLPIEEIEERLAGL